MALYIPGNYDHQSLENAVSRAEQYVAHVMAKVNARVDAKMAYLDQLQKRLDVIKARVAEINEDTMLEFPAKFPLVDKIEKSLADEIYIKPPENTIFQLLSKVEQDIDEIRMPFIPKFILPNLELPKTKSELAELLTKKREMEETETREEKESEVEVKSEASFNSSISDLDDIDFETQSKEQVKPPPPLAPPVPATPPSTTLTSQLAPPPPPPPAPLIIEKPKPAEIISNSAPANAPTSSRANLLASIREGKKLKKVTIKEEPKKVLPKGDDLMASLAAQLESRRKSIKPKAGDESDESWE